MPNVIIDPNSCKGCGLCVSVCPKKIIKMSEDKINKKGMHYAVMTDSQKCIGCTFCALMCPDCVITITKDDEESDGHV